MVLIYVTWLRRKINNLFCCYDTGTAAGAVPLFCVKRLYGISACIEYVVCYIFFLSSIRFSILKMSQPSSRMGKLLSHKTYREVDTKVSS